MGNGENGGMDLEDKLVALGLFLLGIAVVGVIFLIGLTTHVSHLKQLDYNKQEIIACIHTNRPANDCKYLVQDPP